MINPVENIKLYLTSKSDNFASLSFCPCHTWTKLDMMEKGKPQQKGKIFSRNWDQSVCPENQDPSKTSDSNSSDLIQNTESD